MLDSDYWKYLAKQFRSIEGGARLRALWTETPGSCIDDWKLNGPVRAKLEFEALARRAGSKMDPKSTDPLAAWLSAMRRAVHNDFVADDGRMPVPAAQIYVPSGRIENLCDVAAEFCCLLENGALEAEHRAHSSGVEQRGQGQDKGLKRGKPVRRNERYEKIDRALRLISQAYPKNHEEVFRLLDERKVPIPNRQPFRSTNGWFSGFQRSPHVASAWLSAAWRKLDLSAFARGRKK